MWTFYSTFVLVNVKYFFSQKGLCPLTFTRTLLLNRLSKCDPKTNSGLKTRSTFGFLHFACKPGPIIMFYMERAPFRNLSIDKNENFWQFFLYFQAYCTDATLMLKIKDLIMLFCTTLHNYGYFVKPIWELVQELRDHYTEVLMQRWVQIFREILSKEDFQPIIVSLIDVPSEGYFILILRVKCRCTMKKNTSKSCRLSLAMWICRMMWFFPTHFPSLVWSPKSTSKWRNLFTPAWNSPRIWTSRKQAPDQFAVELSEL